MKILHITGVGHSGSTLLATLLAQDGRAASFGELTQLARALDSVPRSCSCGQPVAACEFWRRVRERWFSLHPELDVSRHAHEQREFQRLEMLGMANKKTDSSDSSVARLVAEIDGLYTALARESGAAYVVDSSKHVGRAAMLRKYSEHEIFVLHLIRDPRGVAWSHQKNRERKPGEGEGHRVQRPLVHTMRRWNRDNYLALRLGTGLGGDRFLTVRYEDLADDPEAILARIEDWACIDLSEARRAVSSRIPMTACHTVAGNVNVRRSPIKGIREDVSWRENLSRWQRFQCWLRADTSLCKRFSYC